MTTIKERASASTRRYVQLFVMAWGFGAVTVPIIMRIWHVDFEQASAAASIAMSFGVIVLRMVALLGSTLPTRTDPDVARGLIGWKTRTLVTVLLLAVLSGVLLASTLLSMLTFMHFGMAWALPPSWTVIWASGLTTAVALFAIPTLVIGWMVFLEVRRAPSMVPMKLAQAAIAANLLLTSHVVDSRFMCSLVSPAHRAMHKAA